MSRFLIATLGSLGDLHPYIAVGRALRDRGQQVVLASSEEYRAAAESAGLEFVAVRPSMAELGDYRDLVTRILDARRGPEYLIRHLVMPHLQSAYETLLRASEGADVVVSHPLTVTLPMVAERRGLPWVATVLSPMSLMSSFDPPVIASAPWFRALRVLGATPYRMIFGLAKRQAWSWEAPLRRYRSELGLPPLNGMALFEGQFSPLRNLALFDPQLAAPQPDWPAHTQVCGSPVFDGTPATVAIRDELEGFLAGGEPPIVFALGSSAVWIAGDFWDQAVAATQRLGRRAILITGPATPVSLPDDIKAFAYLPYSIVFPRAAAIVHQAGIGTLAQAMRSGRPQLIVPVAFDQPDNARRAGLIGVARVLPFKKVTSGKLARELGELLSRSHYAEAAGALALDLSKADGAARVAEELIACVPSGSSAG
jgi:rhamnosyltransferase subunit B